MWIYFPPEEFDVSESIVESFLPSVTWAHCCSIRIFSDPVFFGTDCVQMRAVPSTHLCAPVQLGLSQFITPEQTETINILMIYLRNTTNPPKQDKTKHPSSSFPRGLQIPDRVLSPCQPAPCRICLHRSQRCHCCLLCLGAESSTDILSFFFQPWILQFAEG